MDGDNRFEGLLLDEFDFVVKVDKTPLPVNGGGIYPKFLAANQAHGEKRSRRWNEVYGSSNVQRSTKMKRFCRKGVPRNFRITVWLAVTGSGARIYANEGDYQRALTTPCKPDFKGVIFEDLRRTFPDNKKFQGSGKLSETLLSKLKTVLEAFASFKPDPGYCQGMNSIAGMFLLLEASEMEAFWLMEQVTCHLVPSSYYSSDLKGLRIERLVFKRLVHKYCPQQYARIEQFTGFELYFDKWFVCLFIDCLPTELTLRIWDILFYEGFKTFHRAAITVIHKLKDEIVQATDFMVLAELFSNMKESTVFVDAQDFVKDMFKLTSNLSRADISKLRDENTPIVEKEIEENAARLRQRQELMAAKNGSGRRTTSMRSSGSVRL